MGFLVMIFFLGCDLDYFVLSVAVLVLFPLLSWPYSVPTTSAHDDLYDEFPQTHCNFSSTGNPLGVTHHHVVSPHFFRVPSKPSASESLQEFVSRQTSWPFIKVTESAPFGQA